MTATDADFDFDAIEPTATRTAVAEEPPTTGGSGRRRVRTTRRALVIALVTGVLTAIQPLALTGVQRTDQVLNFLAVAVITFVGAHAHRWAWFVAGALLAAVLRDGALIQVLLALVAAVLSTRFANRAKDIGALSVGLLAGGVFEPGGQNEGWITIPVALLAFAILIGSGFPNLRRKHRRIVGWGFAVTAVLLLLASGAAAFAVARSVGDVGAGAASARNALAAVRRGDTETAQRELAAANASLDKAESLLGPLTGPAAYVPGLAQQVDAITTSVAQARNITGVADALVETNYHSLRYKGSIDLATVYKLQGPTASVATALLEGDEQMAELEDRWLLPFLDDRVSEFAADIREARADTELASQALGVLPDLLGGNGPRRYAVAFITPAELRGGGGFIGSWAELVAFKGKVRLADSGRIADLITAGDPQSRKLNGPQDYKDRYGRLQPQRFLQDITYSPNWPSNAAVFGDLYTQATGRPVDGVIGVDPTGLAALLELTGPVTVEGLDIPLRSSNAVRLLTRQQYLQFTDRSEREDVLAAALKATFQKLVDASLPAPEDIGMALGPAARGRHLQVWSRVPGEQALFRTVHADSELRIPEGGDGFTVVQQNVGNNKLDAYLQRKISYDVTVDAADGSLEGTMTIRLENQVADLSYPDAVVGNRRGAPRGTNVATVSIHAPWTVRSATIDGKEQALGRGTEAGLLAWDTPVVQIPPGGAVTIVLRIAGSVDLGDGLDLRVLPQPVAQADELDLRVRLDGGRFGDPDGDHGYLELSANAQEVRLTGRMDQIVDLQVPATR